MEKNASGKTADHYDGLGRDRTGQEWNMLGLGLGKAPTHSDNIYVHLANWMYI